ncbi:MAG: hypothetical protein QOJ76_2648 [Acidobacteriota bacterium]|jgi:hypothetical protein|nr:hypothetical protein [Acidobacteriota bacterium]
MGNVYLFNTTLQELTLTINGVQTASKLPAMTSTAEGFKFGTSIIARTEDAKPRKPVFGDENTLAVSRKQGTDNYTVSIDPDQHPLEQDLQMVIFYKGMVMSYGGLVLQNNFGTVSANEVKTLMASSLNTSTASKSGAKKGGASKSAKKR